jgi:tRNA dimethylallyltransferase
MATSINKPLIVVVGPTASGKSQAAITIALQHSGEIICSDSRTIYSGMDIGTAKPSRSDQEKVPHWGLDLIDPNEKFSAADFKSYALQKIEEIRARGNTPIMVGGTGLYVDSVVFDYQFGPPVDLEMRAQLEELSLDDLYSYCNKNNISLPENFKNKRYVIRAIELKSTSSTRLEEPISNCFIVGITTSSDELTRRIHKRSEQLFDDGVVDEARMLGNTYGWDTQSMTGSIYRLARAYLQREITIDELKLKNEAADRKLAKRQLTWLKRNQFIAWVRLSEIENYIDRMLAPSPSS